MRACLFFLTSLRILYNVFSPNSPLISLILFVVHMTFKLSPSHFFSFLLPLLNIPWAFPCAVHILLGLWPSTRVWVPPGATLLKKTGTLSLRRNQLLVRSGGQISLQKYKTNTNFKLYSLQQFLKVFIFPV